MDASPRERKVAAGAGWDIRNLRSGDADAAAGVLGGEGWNPDRSRWHRYLEEQSVGVRESVVCISEGRPVGYASLVWFSRYRPFRDADIPEISDLAVAGRLRGRGVATALIRELEGRARARGRPVMGIGVGLHSGYGAAQRLYVGLGYQFDGRGATAAWETVRPGARVRMDDELVVWLTRGL